MSPWDQGNHEGHMDYIRTMKKQKCSCKYKTVQTHLQYTVVQFTLSFIFNVFICKQYQLL